MTRTVIFKIPERIDPALDLGSVRLQFSGTTGFLMGEEFTYAPPTPGDPLSRGTLSFVPTNVDTGSSRLDQQETREARVALRAESAGVFGRGTRIVMEVSLGGQPIGTYTDLKAVPHDAVGGVPAATIGYILASTIMVLNDKQAELHQKS